MVKLIRIIYEKKYILGGSMNKEKVLERINEVFRVIFDDETLEVDENTTANDVEGWDSLTHINIIASVEKEFGIDFSTKEVISMKNIGDMVDIILEKV